jgi:hypothetical protein
MISLCPCAKSSEDNVTHKTVKLTPRSSNTHLATRELLGRYANSQTPIRVSPPAYPFNTSQIQRAILRQKTCDPPVSWRIPARLVFRFSGPLRSLRHRSFPSPSRLRFGERVFTETGGKPQEGKTRYSQFFHTGRKMAQNLGVGARLTTRERYPRNFLAV